MGSANPRSTNDLVAAVQENLKSIQPHSAYWNHLRLVKFHETYRTAMLQAGIPQGKADEIGAVIRTYIERIVDSLDAATYAMREIVGEVADVRSRTRTGQTGDVRFRV